MLVAVEAIGPADAVTHRRRTAAVGPADAAAGEDVAAANPAHLLDTSVLARPCWIPGAVPTVMALAGAGIRQNVRVAAVANAARCFRMGVTSEFVGCANVMGSPYPDNGCAKQP
jgi:hypothetical protein